MSDVQSSGVDEHSSLVQIMSDSLPQLVVTRVEERSESQAIIKSLVTQKFISDKGRFHENGDMTVFIFLFLKYI